MKLSVKYLEEIRREEESLCRFDIWLALSGLLAGIGIALVILGVGI